MIRRFMASLFLVAVRLHLGLALLFAGAGLAACLRGHLELSALFLALSAILALKAGLYHLMGRRVE